MDSNAQIIALIGYILGLIILYFIIQSAVSSANWDVKGNTRLSTRYFLVRMKKEGFTQEEIDLIHSLKDKKFYEWYNEMACKKVSDKDL